MDNFSPHVLRQVAKEMGQLQKDPPEGIKVHCNEEDITDIQASIDGPGSELRPGLALFNQSRIDVLSMFCHFSGHAVRRRPVQGEVSAEQEFSE